MPVPSAQGPWRWRHLLEAPHRLGFFLAMLVLGASGLWWAAVQLQRSGLIAPVPLALSPSVVHGAVMAFGFFPLFFAGFLFTAGPRWLGVRGPTAPRLLPPLAAQAGGWLVWLAGSHVHAWVAISGLALAASGMLRVTLLFWGLVRASREAARLHPQVAGVALAAACACLAGLAVALAAGAELAPHLLVASGLWASVGLVFVAAGHRMIPFFAPPPGSRLEARGDRWALPLLAGAMLFEGAAVWLQELFAGIPSWQLARAVPELAAGGLLLWSAAGWNLARNARNRLLAMLHLGFVWIGIALLLQGGAALGGWHAGRAALPLAGLHAFGMGALGSLMLAMVTRVTAGHGGSPVVAGDFVWGLFWVLQGATVLRVAATLPSLPPQPLLTAAALAWAAVVLAWGVRYGSGYGRLAVATRRR